MKDSNGIRFKTILVKYIFSVSILAFFFPQIASAYVGPGTGLSAIGAFLALVAGVIIAIIGFLWYPIKRLFNRKKDKEELQDDKKEV